MELVLKILELACLSRSGGNFPDFSLAITTGLSVIIIYIEQARSTSIYEN